MGKGNYHLHHAVTQDPEKRIALAERESTTALKNQWYLFAAIRFVTVFAQGSPVFYAGRSYYLRHASQTG